MIKWGQRRKNSHCELSSFLALPTPEPTRTKPHKEIPSKRRPKGEVFTMIPSLPTGAAYIPPSREITVKYARIIQTHLIIRFLGFRVATIRNIAGKTIWPNKAFISSISNLRIHAINAGIHTYSMQNVFHGLLNNYISKPRLVKIHQGNSLCLGRGFDGIFFSFQGMKSPS